MKLLIKLLVSLMTVIALLEAQEQQVLSFDSLMQKVLLQSTQAAKIKLATAQTKAEAVSVNTLENPTLVIDSTARHSKASDVWSVELEQPLKWSQFGAVQNYAQLLESTADLEHKAQLLDLRHTVLFAYVDCWIEQEKYSILQDQLTLIKQQQSAIEQAESKGKISRLEAELLSIDFIRMQEALRAAKLQSDAKNTALLQMAGLKQQNFIATKIALPSLPSLEQIIQHTDQDTGAKALLAQQAQLAKSRYLVAKKDANLPEIAPRAIYEKDEDDNSSSFLLGLSITLPIWNRNQEELINAQAQLALMKTALQQVESGSWDVALKSYYKQAQAWRESTNHYQQNMLPKWQSIKQLIADKFDSGQISISDLADYQQQEIDLKFEALESYVKAIEASITLEKLTGKVL